MVYPLNAAPYVVGSLSFGTEQLLKTPSRQAERIWKGVFFLRQGVVLSTLSVLQRC